MPNIHPLVVHFPVALLTFSFFFDLLGIVTRRKEYERTGWWSLLAGFAGLAVTIPTGLFAENSVVLSEAARPYFETHEQLAFGAAGVYCILLLWRVGNRSSLPVGQKGWYVGLSCIGVALLWATAWFGGELVFGFGTGVHQ